MNNKLSPLKCFMNSNTTGRFLCARGGAPQPPDVTLGKQSQHMNCQMITNHHDEKKEQYFTRLPRWGLIQERLEVSMDI